MNPKAPRYMLSLVFALAATGAALIGLVEHVSAVFILAASVPLLLCAALSLGRRHSKTRPGWQFWNTLLIGLVFLCGGGYGIFRSLHGSGQWPDELPLILPIALGLFLIRFAFKHRAPSQTGPAN